MIKQGYGGNEKRALNIIWNAAENYDFTPPFMAFRTHGTPDPYFNMVIGFAYKWLDLEEIAAFLRSYAGYRKADEFDDLLWLGIENCVYEKEIAERPHLAELRRQRGEAFFAERQTLSEQQMMLQSMPVYDQQEARWASVTGRKMPRLSEKAKRMHEALAFPGSLTEMELIPHMREFLRTFFRYEAGTDGRGWQGSLRSRIPRLFPGENRRKDFLIVPSGTEIRSEDGLVMLPHGAGKSARFLPDEEDEEYIQSLFGPCAMDEADLRQIEEAVCTGGDRGIKLWISRGGSCNADGLKGKAKAECADRKRQEEKNRAYRKAHAQEAAGSIRTLSGSVEAVFEEWKKHLPEGARAGSLCAEKAFRLAVVRDPKVFLRPGDEAEKNITVDLMLDASASRMNAQELIALESYIMAKSFVRAGIPVRVLSFRSLRGYTVLEILKSYEDLSGDGIFRYSAGGWNRDAAALKAMRVMLAGERRSPDEHKLLIVLTDASPNDAVPLFPETENGRLREYEGSAAVEEAARAVKALKKSGIAPAAIFHGATYHLDNVPQIYGNAYVRVRSLAQLAGACGLLLEALTRTDPA